MRAHNEPLTVPAYADDGGEEPEVAGVYLIDGSGMPRRIGFTTANEFSDHILHGKTAEAERLCAWYLKVFGEENFVVPIIWQKRITPENRRAFSFEHDYLLCYAKSAETFREVRRFGIHGHVSWPI